MDPEADSRHHRQLTNGKDTWRARCQEIGTPGSAGGHGKRTRGNPGTAPVSDPTLAQPDHTAARGAALDETGTWLVWLCPRDAVL